MDTIPRIVRFERCNPLRRVDWRWQHARRIVADGRHVSRRREDEECITAVHFARDLDRCRTDKDRARLQRRWPGIYEAYQLANLSLEEFTGSSYIRLKRVGDLLQSGFLGDDLRWQRPGRLHAEPGPR